jgi:lactoylglutathione lyase
MQLGAFSISLAVRDMAASRAFYEKLGFHRIAGDGEAWTIVANETGAIGLFHDKLDANVLTFNPGWVGLGEPAETFTDVRQLRAQLAAAGLEPQADTTADAPTGPASFTVTDPDGNTILIDQHV